MTQVEFVTAAASTNFSFGWVPLDIAVTPFNMSWFLNRSGVGAVHSLIEGTLTDFSQQTSAAVAFTLADVSSNSGGGNSAAAWTTPITGIRLTSSASAASTLTFRVLQVGT